MLRIPALTDLAAPLVFDQQKTFLQKRERERNKQQALFGQTDTADLKKFDPVQSLFAFAPQFIPCAEQSPLEPSERFPGPTAQQLGLEVQAEQLRQQSEVAPLKQHVGLGNQRRHPVDNLLNGPLQRPGPDRLFSGRNPQLIDQLFQVPKDRRREFKLFALGRAQQSVQLRSGTIQKLRQHARFGRQQIFQVRHQLPNLLRA